MTTRHSLDSRITGGPRVMSGPVSHLSSLVNKPQIPGRWEAGPGPWKGPGGCGNSWGNFGNLEIDLVRCFCFKEKSHGYELHWSLDTEPILGEPIMGRLNLVELIQVIRLSGLLVGGDWNMAFMTFHILGIIIPTDERIFFRGVGWNHQPVYMTYIYLLSNSQALVPSRAFQLLFLHRWESVDVDWKWSTPEIWFRGDGSVDIIDCSNIDQRLGLVKFQKHYQVLNDLAKCTLLFSII